MPEEKIIVKGAREHNLKNIDLELPKNSLIIFTGVSGSGKSSLAFDTLYAEGRRRYVESLSAYARQFLGTQTKPDVDFIDGLSPAISIDQKSAGSNPRSTVATITEIYDYLRVLFASIGIPHCPKCGRQIGAQTADEIVEQILALPQRSRIQILAPIVKGRRGEYKEELKEALKAGFVRARVDGQMFDLMEEIRLDRNLRHDIEIVVDRIIIKEGVRDRVAEAVEIALEVGEGNLIVNVVGQVEHPFTSFEDRPDGIGGDILYNQNYACAECNISMEAPTPQMFSFNSPHGMCPTCRGLGALTKMSPDLVVPDKTKSIRDGAIVFWGKLDALHTEHLAEGLAKHYKFSLDTPWNQLTEGQRQAVLYGSGGARIRFVYRTRAGRRWYYERRYEGVITEEERKYFQSQSEAQKRFLSRFMTSVVCPDCHGDRLRPEAKTVTISDKSILDIVKMSVDECQAFFDNLKLNERQQFIAEEVLKEIKGRLWFLMNVGLHYLTLDRTAPTLSGGESQRIRLASQIGSGLMGVLYILDEPSVGLHQRDNKRLLDTLKHLRDRGNTVIVAEHDEETIRSGDYIVDFGPGAGIKGGEIVATGMPSQISENENSLTGQYLSGKQQIPIPEKRRPMNDKWIEIIGARHNNLKNIDVGIPVGLFTCVTGVSGSGKSSLINDILFQALDRELMRAHTNPKEHDAIRGIEHLDKVINIDQSPIGRTPRSNPATYAKVFDQIRSFYAQLPESQVRGYKPGRFSFNVKGGRCEACKGSGLKRIEMHFLADVWVKCEVCGGKRYNNETLEVKYKGKHITDVLEMDVQEALKHFENLPKITRILQTLHDVGLDYIKLGQPAPTLSGGEAQRVKLAKELRRVSTGKTLYILDEPTTGLHFADVKHLLNVLHHLTDAGNTVVVIEHNPEVIKTADYIIDLGPEGGEEGGCVVATGTPEQVAQIGESYTGRVLQEIFERRIIAPKTVGNLTDGKEGREGWKNVEDVRFAQRLLRESPAGSLDGRMEGWKKRTALNSEFRFIRIRGAKEHNLKNIDVDIPHRQMTVFTGISGSGKSSLALDTIYAEGQRRYVESLSAYARQFLGQIQKPKVEHIDGLSPAIAIEQKTPSQNPRSTVGTVTEIYDYMRVLYARVGTPHCPKCGREIGAQTLQQIVDRIIQKARWQGGKRAIPNSDGKGARGQKGFEEGARIYVLSPLGIERGEDYDVALDRIQKDGYVRVRIDGEIYDLSERKGQSESVESPSRSRIPSFSRAKSVPTEVGRSLTNNANSEARRRFPKLDRRIKHDIEVVVDRLVVRPDEQSRLSESVETALRQSGGIVTIVQYSESGRKKPIAQTFSEHFACVHCGLSFKELTPQDFSFNSPLGMCQSCEGLGVTRRGTVCRRCKGSRIKPEARAVTLGGKSIVEVTAMTIQEAAEFFDKLSGADIPICHSPHLTETQMEIAKEVLNEIRNRLRFLIDVGLDYLTLDRPAPTLAGGEAQRIRLASQLGSGLTGVLYVLDEPTIGLHPRDNERLLNALKNLRDLGNSVIVVEHDRNTILSSDRVVDFGPGAGTYGGEIVAEGSPSEIHRQEQSLTGKYLAGKLSIETPENRRPGKGQSIQIIGAKHNNLKNIDVKIPLGTLTCVTGVSGSGKSSLIEETLYKAVVAKMHRTIRRREVIKFDQIGEHELILGTEHIDKVINIDQKPIGETPRSNPATYTDVFTDIRYLFAELPEAKMKGFSSRRFSFNLKVGQCESCKGNGYNLIEMHFLPDVWVKCDSCGGTGYNKQTLEIRYRGKNIAEVLEMTVQEALEHFHNIPKIQRKLQTLCDVGLDYIQLGQSATTLSGGEAQRVKLAKELARRSTGKTLYIMDEPTTGLHFVDIKRLLKVLARLVDKGNTVVIIEHNLDVIKCADYIIDLGPEGGDAGGYIVACGTPEEIVQVAASHTGRFLKQFLAQRGNSR